MKILYDKYDKTKIGDLPRVLFQGRVIVVLTEEEAEKAINYLLTCKVLGFDTETRPVFKRGTCHKVALLQVSSEDTCFLFRLNRIGWSPSLTRLMETEDVVKIGLSWHDDIMSLHKRGEFEAKGFFELQDHVGELGILDKSLAKLYANFFGERISKREQLSNWEADVLSEKQKGYAATDAWACVQLYKEYLRLKESGDYELIVTAKEEETATNTESKTNV
jgi:ribonuclease D